MISLGFLWTAAKGLLNLDKIVPLVLIGGVAVAGFIYITSLQKSVYTLEDNNEKLQLAITKQQEVLDQKTAEFDLIRKLIDDQAKLNVDLQFEITDLEEKFNKVNAQGVQRDVGELSVAKPSLIQNVINRGTKKAFDCLEIATGANNEGNTDCIDIIR